MKRVWSNAKKCEPFPPFTKINNNPFLFLSPNIRFPFQRSALRRGPWHGSGRTTLGTQQSSSFNVSTTSFYTALSSFVDISIFRGCCGKVASCLGSTVRPLLLPHHQRSRCLQGKQISSRSELRSSPKRGRRQSPVKVFPSQ